MRKRAVVAAVAAVPIALTVAGTATASASSSTTRDASRTTTAANSIFTATVLTPVPLNRARAIGTAFVRLRGNQANMTVKVAGLIKAPHAMHIHHMGQGECPTREDGRLHNGRRSISTVDGLEDYGPIGTSLTTSGDTSPKSALAISRFPQKGNFTYYRKIWVSDAVARSIRTGNAVVVVHGIDYNNNGKYDYVLGVSELTPTLPQEATAPALCGPLARRVSF